MKKAQMELKCLYAFNKGRWVSYPDFLLTVIPGKIVSEKQMVQPCIPIIQVHPLPLGPWGCFQGFIDENFMYKNQLYYFTLHTPSWNSLCSTRLCQYRMGRE